MDKILLLLLLLVHISLQEEIPVLEISGDSCASSDAASQILQEVQKLQQRDAVDTCQVLQNATQAELNDLTLHMKSNLLRVVGDLKEAKSERDELKASLQELKETVSSIKAESMAVAKFVSDFSTCKTLLAARTHLKLVQLSVGRYFYHPQEMRHSAAGAWCKEKGMRLAQFETLEQMEIVMENATYDGVYWAGATDVGFAPGDFRWSDGSRVAGELWFSGKPSSHGAGIESCVFTSQNSKKLWDAWCINTYRPVCEVPPQFSNCL